MRWNTPTTPVHATPGESSHRYHYANGKEYLLSRLRDQRDGCCYKGAACERAQPCEKKNYQNNWTGGSSSGVYFYTVTNAFCPDRNYKGTVTISR